MQALEKTVEFDTVADNLFGLVIDDQRTMRSIVRQILNQIGVDNITDYPDGSEAWDYLTLCGTEVPDFIICDLHMDGMDGLEFVNKVRRSKNARVQDIPILILTGDPEKLLHQVADQVGAARVIQKPISAPDLREEIAHMLRLQT